MPRHGKRLPPTQQVSMRTFETTQRKMQSMLVSPDFWGWMRSGVVKGLREKILKVDFQTIRNVVDRVPLISAIINSRCDQVKAYGKYTQEKSEPGYQIVPRTDPGGSNKITGKDEKIIAQLANFIDQTGVDYDPEREDDFTDYLDMVNRETLTVDAVATELQRNRIGNVHAFWLIDGTTIKRVDKREKLMGMEGIPIRDDARFVQVIQDHIMNDYTDNDLIYDFKNKRADLRFRGWGYAPTEMAIDLITTLLFGYNYLRDQLMRDRVPKGFISIMGDVGKDQLDAVRDYWYYTMSGAGGAWSIPILPSGKDGVGMEWKGISSNNREMEYHKLMMFVSSIIAAVFSFDMAEMGIKSDDSQPLIGESMEPRIRSSKDRGLKSLLMFIERHMNKIMRKVNPNYIFKFTGVKEESQKEKAELHKLQVETNMTIDEIRESLDMEPLNEEWSGVVLNPGAIQIYNAGKAREQQEKMAKSGLGPNGQPLNQGKPGENGDGKGEEGDGEEDQTGEEKSQYEGSEVDWQKMFKSRRLSKSVRVIIE